MLGSVISLITETLTTCFGYVNQLMTASGTSGFWFAGVVFVFAFSIIVMPLRGGIRIGALGDYTVNSISNKNREEKSDRKWAERQWKSRLYRKV